MHPDDVEVRASFSLFPSDVKALRRLTLLLRDQDLPVKRTDTFRALIEGLSEKQMHAAVADRLKSAAGTEQEIVEERFTIRLRKGWVKKLDRVCDEFARHDVDVERTYVARCLLHSEYDPKWLVRMVRKLEDSYPDERMWEVRKRR